MKKKKDNREGTWMEVDVNLGFGVEDKAFVQRISHPPHQLLPDTIFQKLLRVDLGRDANPVTA